MKKKIVSVVLAFAMLCSLAITVQAQTIRGEGTYGGCTYTTYTNCATDNCSAVMQLKACHSGNVDDYIFQIEMTYYYTYTVLGIPQEESATVYSLASPQACSISRRPGTMKYVDCNYYLNTVRVAAERAYPN